MVLLLHRVALPSPDSRGFAIFSVLWTTLTQPPCSPSCSLPPTVNSSPRIFFSQNEADRLSNFDFCLEVHTKTCSRTGFFFSFSPPPRISCTSYPTPDFASHAFFGVDPESPSSYVLTSRFPFVATPKPEVIRSVLFPEEGALYPPMYF